MQPNRTHQTLFAAANGIPSTNTTARMHADHRDFGPVVTSLSLGATWPMRFRLRGSTYNKKGQPGDELAMLPRRSLLVLAGGARDRWMHGIDPADTARETDIRISATFRTVPR